MTTGTFITPIWDYGWLAVTGHFKRDHPGSKLGGQNHPPLSARGLVAIMG